MKPEPPAPPPGEGQGRATGNPAGGAGPRPAVPRPDTPPYRSDAGGNGASGDVAAGWGGERYRRLVGRLPALVFELAPDGSCRFVNDAAAALTGYRPDQLLGRNFWQTLCPGTLARGAAALRARLASGDVTGYEIHLATASGGIRLLALDTANEYGPDGRLAAVLGCGLDLTPRRQAEAAQRQLAAIVAGSDDAIVGESLDGVIASWNAAAERLYGYPAAEALGRSAFLLVPPDRAGELPPLLRRLRRGERVDHFETVRMRKGGHAVHVSLTLSPIRDEAGAITGTSTIARDITQRKRAEEQISLLAHAVESSTELICITDLQDRFTFVNRAFLEAYGYTEAEVLGRHPDMLRPAGQGPVVGAEILERTRRGGWQGELVNRRKDGSEFPIFLSTSVIKDELGKSIGLIGIARDITEVKRAEQALRDSEGRYRLLFESNLAGVLGTTTEGRVLDCNEAFARMLGYERPEEVQQLRAQDFYLDVADRATLLAQLWEQRSLKNLEIRFRRRDGQVVWVLANVSLLAEDRATSLMHGTVIDITERKRAEEALRASEKRYRSVVEGSLQGISIQQDGVVKYANPEYARIFGYEQPADVIGLPWESFIVADDRPAVHARAEECVGGAATARLGWRGVRRDGSHIWVESAISTITWEDRPALASFLIDITDRKEAEGRLQEYAARLKALTLQLMTAQETERRHLARELHDELGQVLTAININLQVIKQHAAPDVQARLEESLSFVDRAIRQVRNLSLDLRPSLLDDLGLEAALRWYLDRLANRSGLTVQFDSRLGPLRLKTDLETACFRVVQEALTNVMRHAKAKTVWVRLRRRGTELRIQVRDDGTGFDMAAARQKSARGGSFGLMGMHERVQTLGGRIRFSSEPGEGTTVRVRMPMA